MPYNHKEIEPKWQKKWEEIHAGEVIEDSKKKEDALYYLTMFPYPSGSGLHVGHVESYTGPDIVTRMTRMQGKNVLFPMGFDAFGLPAENYAIQTGVHPVETTKTAIENFTRQMKALGFDFDWSRDLSTADPEYYKWTQWMFLQLYKNDLAYKKKAPVNWCESCKTVLANEQVIEGNCERCHNIVVQKDLAQWFFATTKYAEQLLQGLEEIDWPSRPKTMQRNWIGKSEGVEWQQKIKGTDITFTAFDSVPQTYTAQTFAVIAPEHELLPEIVKGKKQEEEVLAFIKAFKKRKAADKFSLDKEMEGIFTGAYVEDPFGTGDLPLWVASFVIADYGSGIVNASAHDTRDFDFAKKYDIPLRPVMFPEDPEEAEKVRNLEYCYYKEPEAIMEQPEEFRGRKWGEIREEIIDFVEKKGFGKRATNYKLRDWLVSRQRYWGAPIPIVYDPEGNAHPVKEEHLPLTLPTDVDFRPEGESPLALSESYKKLAEELYGDGWRFEVDTMDTFVDSSWYFLRFCDPNNEQVFASKEALEYWGAVDLYTGGVEHSLLHLLYARFFTKALYDLGFVAFQEPFLKYRFQGTILGPDGVKMSKSRGNVINPDDVVNDFGADTLRLYTMFMGPFEDDKPWDEKSVVGVRRFLDKAFRLVEKVGDASDDVERVLHKTIKKVTEDTPAMRFNTAIAQMMIFTNEATSKGMSSKQLKTFTQLLAPYAPHLTEEIWEKLGEKDSVFESSWPEYDPELVKDDLIQMPVQVNGKVRATLEVDPEISEADAVALAQEDANVQKHLDGKEPKKVVFVKGRLISFVV